MPHSIPPTIAGATEGAIDGSRGAETTNLTAQMMGRRYNTTMDEFYMAKTSSAVTDVALFRRARTTAEAALQHEGG